MGHKKKIEMVHYIHHLTIIYQIVNTPASNSPTIRLTESLFIISKKRKNENCPALPNSVCFSSFYSKTQKTFNSLSISLQCRSPCSASEKTSFPAFSFCKSPVSNSRLSSHVPSTSSEISIEMIVRLLQIFKVITDLRA